jgi:hypothetical protein
MSIGSQHGDTIQNIKGSLSFPYSIAYGEEYENTGALRAALYTLNDWSIPGGSKTLSGLRGIGFDASYSVRTGDENAPTWVAVYVCIRY